MARRCGRREKMGETVRTSRHQVRTSRKGWARGWLSDGSRAAHAGQLGERRPDVFVTRQGDSACRINTCFPFFLPKYDDEKKYFLLKRLLRQTEERQTCYVCGHVGCFLTTVACVTRFADVVAFGGRLSHAIVDVDIVSS